MEYTNSKLVSYVDSGVNTYSFVRNVPISRITIHHAAGIFDLHGYSQLIRDQHSSSWNYCIANDGSIGLFVEESRQAWATSNTSNDQAAVNIIVSDSTDSAPWKTSDKAYEALLRLCEDICRRNNISALTFTGSESGSNLTMHKWYAGIDCPGEYLESKFNDIASTVNSRLKSESKLSQYYVIVPETVNENAFSYGITGEISIDNLHKDKLTPYLVTLTRNSPEVNYDDLKKIGVSGAIIEAGYFYDSIHLEQSVFRNPRLSIQIKAAESANIPYGMFMEVRARSVDEARKEMSAAKLTIRKYPVTLGFWLKLSPTNIKSINDEIIDYCCKELSKLGLENKIGLYMTEEQLKKISWEKYYNKCLLWLDKHVNDISEIDELLTPEFFDVQIGIV